MPNTSSKRKQPLTKSSGVRERIAEGEETQSQHREQEESRVQQQLEAAWELARLVDLDRRTLCNHLLAQIVALTQSRYGFFGFLNDDESVMTLYSWSIRALWDCQIKDKPFEFPISKAGLWAEAVRQRKTFIINHYQAGHPAKRGLPEGHIPITRILVVPIMRGNRVVAVAAVSNKPTEYTEADAKQINALATIAQLILERQQANEELKKLRQNYEALVASIDGIVWEADAGNFRFSLVSQQAEQVLGYPVERWLAEPTFWQDHLHPEDRNKVLALCQQAVAERRNQELEYRMIAADGRIVWLRDVVSVVVEDGQVVKLCGVMVDITQHKQAQETLCNIAQEVSAATGKAFFHSLVRHLAKALNVEYAFVGELVGGEKVRTLAVCAHGEIATDFEYDLANTPCQNVVGKSFCSYASGVQQQFPNDHLLRTMGIESYAGIPLFDVAGRAIGLMVVMGQKPLSNPEGVEAMLRIFAVRASAELERKQAEEALRKSRDELERRVKERTEELVRANQELQAEISERKQAEEQLRESETRYRALVEAGERMGEAVILLQDTERVRAAHLFANQEWSRITGYTAEELREISYLDLVHPRYRQAVADRIRRRFEGQDIANRYEISIIAKDGREVPVEAAGALITYRGKPATVGYIRDITRRKQAEEKIRQLSHAVEQSASTVVITDAKGDIVYVNPRFTETSGYLPEEVIGKNPRILKSETKPSEEYKELWETITSGRDWRGEFLNKRKDGKLYWESATISPIKDYDGTITHFIAIKEDITERKQLEEELNKHRHHLEELVAERTAELEKANKQLREEIAERKRAQEEIQKSREYIQSILNNSLDLIFTIKSDGTFSFFNKSLEPMTGYKEEELLGRPFIDYVAAEERAEVMRRWQEVLQGIPGSYETKIIKADGEIAHVFFSYSLLKEYDEVLVVLRDITERKKMEEQLIVADRLASLGELASGIAHELNNPLTGIIGFSELLMGKDIPEEIKGDLVIINKEAKRTAGIVRNLLTFARHHPAAKELVDINEIIQAVLQLRAYEQRVHNIEVKTRFACDLPKVMANGFQLQQVFINIIINAEYFMIEAHGRGTLTITTEQVEDMVRASFADDGPGIAKENLPHLFDPFFTTKKIGKGTGLGLSICHGIVTEHGGRIYAQSEPGKGATFVIELPIQAALGR